MGANCSRFNSRRRRTLLVNEVVDALMADYDKRFKTASPYSRSSYRFEAFKILQDLNRIGLKVVPT